MRCQSDRALEQESSAHLDCEDSKLWRLIRLANRVSGFKKSVIGNSFLSNHSQNQIRRWKSDGRSSGRYRINDVGDTQSVFAVDDNDFALGDEASVEQQIHGRMESVIEFDDDSGTKGEYIAQQHSAGSEAELDVEPDIHEAAVTGGGRSRRRRRWLR